MFPFYFFFYRHSRFCPTVLMWGILMYHKMQFLTLDKKRTKQNCHLFWREMISKLPRQYTHMITRDTTYETIFFATKHSTWLLFVNTQLGLHHITCFKPYPPQSAEWTIWVQFLRCDAFFFLPLIVVSELQLQFCWSAVSKWSYDVRAFGLLIVPL